MRVVQGTWMAAGLACVGLAYVGYVLPGLPGTVFLIGALYCFRRGSSKFEGWLLNHPWFGRTLREWETYRGMRLKTKKIALATMWIAVIVSAVMYWSKPIVEGIVAGAAVFATWYIWTRPTVPEHAAVIVEQEATSRQNEPIQHR